MISVCVDVRWTGVESGTLLSRMFLLLMVSLQKRKECEYIFCDGALVGVAVILYTHRIAIRGSEFSRI